MNKKIHTLIIPGVLILAAIFLYNLIPTEKDGAEVDIIESTDIGIVEKITDKEIKVLFISNLNSKSFNLTHKALDSIDNEGLAIGSPVTFKYKGTDMTNIMEVNALTVVGNYKSINTGAKTLSLDIKGKPMALKYDEKVEKDLIKVKDKPLALNVKKVNDELVIVGVIG